MQGIKINYEKIAEGIYEMVHVHLDENYVGALSLGMLPAPLMECAERNFIDKCWEVMGYKTADERKRAKANGIDIDRDEVKAFMKRISRELLKIADDRGLLKV